MYICVYMYICLYICKHVYMYTQALRTGVPSCRPRGQVPPLHYNTGFLYIYIYIYIYKG